MAWSPFQRSNAGIIWVEHPGDYANPIPTTPATAPHFVFARTFGRHSAGDRMLDSGGATLGRLSPRFILEIIAALNKCAVSGCSGQLMVTTSQTLKNLVPHGHCSSMPVFGKPMRWVTCVTAPILLADVGDYRVRVFSLDLKRTDKRTFGVHGDVVRLLFQFKPDGELHRHASSTQYFGPDVRRCLVHV